MKSWKYLPKKKKTIGFSLSPYNLPLTQSSWCWHTSRKGRGGSLMSTRPEVNTSGNLSECTSCTHANESYLLPDADREAETCKRVCCWKAGGSIMSYVALCPQKSCKRPKESGIWTSNLFETIKNINKEKKNSFKDEEQQFNPGRKWQDYEILLCCIDLLLTPFVYELYTVWIIGETE